jgi:subtilisin-like proprotein convertase family protein
VTPTAQSIATLVADANAFFNTHQIEILATPTGAEAQSLLADVRVYTLVPPVPDLIIPVDGSVNIATLAPFTWTHTYQAENYVLEVDDDPTFSSIDLLASGSGVTHISTTPLQPLTTYYWRVLTSNACGEVLSPVHSFTTAGTNLFCSSPNLSLSSASPISDSINITQIENLVDLDVTLDIVHTWVGDIKATLTHVDTGTSIVLIDRPGVTTATAGFGCSGNDVNVTLSDSGSTAAEDQCLPTAPALMGTLTPNNPLSAFTGESLAGTWTILAEDLAGGDSGTFNQWCLAPTQLPEPTSFILLSTGILFMSSEQALRRRRRRKSAADPR